MSEEPVKANLFATLSTLLRKTELMLTDRPDLLRVWDVDESILASALVLAAMREYPTAQILVGTSSVKHVAQLIDGISELSKSTIDLESIRSDLFAQESPPPGLMNLGER